MNNYIKLGKISISNKLPPLVVPEVGINHDGSIEKAFNLVDSAIDCGCKIIKFQTHITEMEMIKTDMKPGNISKLSLWDIIKKAELTKEEEFRLFNYCNKKGIEFLSTPFSREAADQLNNLGVNSFKIGSGECNNLPLIEYICKLKKPLILSTGMNDLKSIHKTVDIINSYKLPLILLHCTSMYPTPPDKIRLGSITQLQNEFPEIPIGFSDHSLENYSAFASIALGAVLIEKHFTISKSWPGPDNFMSQEPKDLKALVKGVQDVWEACGGNKNILEEEKPVIDFAYASVVLIKSVSKGDLVSEENTWVKRPGNGEIQASAFSSIKGKKFAKNLKKDYQLKYSDIQ